MFKCLKVKMLKCRSGFTIIELLIAITIFTLVLSSIFSIFIFSLKRNQKLMKNQNQVSAVRNIFSSMEKEIRNAEVNNYAFRSSSICPDQGKIFKIDESAPSVSFVLNDKCIKYRIGTIGTNISVLFKEGEDASDGANHIERAVLDPNLEVIELNFVKSSLSDPSITIEMAVKITGQDNNKALKYQFTIDNIKDTILKKDYLKEWTEFNEVYDTVKNGDYAYVATDQGLKIFNISDPKNIQLVGPPDNTKIFLQDTQEDFETGWYINYKTSTSQNPGSIEFLTGETDGAFTSPVYNIGDNFGFGTVSRISEPPGCEKATAKVKTCNEYDCSDSPGWDGCEVASGSDLSDGSCVDDEEKYIQYRVVLSGQDICPFDGDTQCNGSNLETCATQVDGCLSWEITDSCNNGPFGGLCDSTPSPFCCTHDCDSIQCGGTGGVQISTCAPPAPGECDDELFEDCATGTCHTGSIGANCCQDEVCTFEDTQCDGTNTAIQTCQTSTVTGCKDWVPESCASIDPSKPTCYPGGTEVCEPGGNACCDIFDESPPVITLNYPSAGQIFYRGNESLINFLATITDDSEISVGNQPITYIQNPDGTDISTLTLYDDGDHGDGGADNDQYGTISWNLTSQPLGSYYIDIFAEDNKGNNIYEDNIGNFTISLKPDGMACGDAAECVSDICCAGTCGEGWKTNGESCSLNCECEGGLCDSGICKTPLYLYYSTSTSTGNIGGRPGADGICKAGGGPSDIDYGTVHAFISINSSSEIRDLPSLYGYDESAPVYYGATKIANNYADLLDGRITQEDGLNDAFLLTSHWWSFSTNSGAIDSNTCSGGTDASMSSRGAKGRDGIVSAAHCTGSPGSYDEWAIRSVCTGGYSLPCVNSYRLLCIGELGLPCENDSECGGGCCIDGICNGDNNLTWPGSTHTECDCLALGGTVFGAASGSFCKLNQQNVPAGWAQANNWQKYGGNMNGSGDVCGHYQSYSYPTDWADEACYIQYCRGSQKPVGGANTCGQCGGSWCDWSGGYSRGIWYVKLAPECGSCGISDRIGVGIR